MSWGFVDQGTSDTWVRERWWDHGMRGGQPLTCLDLATQSPSLTFYNKEHSGLPNSKSSEFNGPSSVSRASTVVTQVQPLAGFLLIIDLKEFSSRGGDRSTAGTRAAEPFTCPSRFLLSCWRGGSWWKPPCSTLKGAYPGGLPATASTTGLCLKTYSKALTVPTRGICSSV